MKTILHIIFIATLFCLSANAQTNIPILDTIVLEKEHITGRWIEEKSSNEKNSIYIFRDDNTFHKAVDNGELLVFNVAGRYNLANDSAKIYYQDFSRAQAGKAKVRTMILQVISLSDNELNINKTENNITEFIRLRRQNEK